VFYIFHRNVTVRKFVYNSKRALSISNIRREKTNGFRHRVRRVLSQRRACSSRTAWSVSFFISIIPFQRSSFRSGDVIISRNILRFPRDTPILGSGALFLRNRYFAYTRVYLINCAHNTQN